MAAAIAKCAAGTAKTSPSQVGQCLLGRVYRGRNPGVEPEAVGRRDGAGGRSRPAAIHYPGDIRTVQRRRHAVAEFPRAKPGFLVVRNRSSRSLVEPQLL